MKPGYRNGILLMFVIKSEKRNNGRNRTAKFGKNQNV